MRSVALLLAIVLTCQSAIAQSSNHFTLLKPARVFDGETMHADWVVLVQGDTIVQAGPMRFKLPGDTKIIELPGTTLLPGLIEGHSHLFLHPYNETSWDDQVLKESRAERTARATNHAKATLMAGFTTVRDLGTEGAMYDDVGLKTAIEKGIIPGPRMIVTTRAIIAKGTYAPRPASPDLDLPQGAAEVSGINGMMEEVRTQISKGANFIKIYADYRWGPKNEAVPAFSIEELQASVQITRSGKRQTVAHATSEEGMRRASLAGVSTIEHGDDGTPGIYTLMKEKGVALCPTLSAGDAIERYKGWKKGTDPEPERITAKRKSFQAALQSGVTICMGGDVGVYTHGDNAREMELMVEYGMKPVDVLKAATSVNARVFGYQDSIGKIQTGLKADLIAIEGDPTQNISQVRKIVFVMKGGVLYKTPLVEGK